MITNHIQLGAIIMTDLVKYTHWCNSGKNFMGVTNHSWLGFKSCSTEYNPYPAQLLSQDHKSWTLGALGESTNTVLLMETVFLVIYCVPTDECISQT